MAGSGICQWNELSIPPYALPSRLCYQLSLMYVGCTIVFMSHVFSRVCSSIIFCFWSQPGLSIRHSCVLCDLCRSLRPNHMSPSTSCRLRTGSWGDEPSLQHFITWRVYCVPHTSLSITSAHLPRLTPLSQFWREAIVTLLLLSPQSDTRKKVMRIYVTAKETSHPIMASFRWWLVGSCIRWRQGNPCENGPPGYYRLIGNFPADLHLTALQICSRTMFDTIGSRMREALFNGTKSERLPNRPWVLSCEQSLTGRMEDINWKLSWEIPEHFKPIPTPRTKKVVPFNVHSVRASGISATDGG